MAPLIDLTDYKALMGIDPTNNVNDTQITALLEAASRAVRAYTDRKFEVTTGIADQWSAQPFGGEVFYYLLILGGPYGGSPEMGFERNLDTIGLRPRSPVLSVTATWGWTAVPEDVKLATAWTINEIVSGPKASENLTAESIESYSRSWGNKAGGTQFLAIPNRARDLLTAYQRIDV
jgi:hypothetical protein